MRKEFRAKQFELAAKSPAAWALQARRLKRAADLVFEAYAGDLAEMHGGRSPLDLKNLESAEPETLLYGLAFENVFKTLILALVSATEPRLSWAGLEGAVLTCADPSCDNVRAFLGGTFFYDANDIVVTLYDFERSPDSTVVIRKSDPVRLVHLERITVVEPAGAFRHEIRKCASLHKSARPLSQSGNATLAESRYTCHWRSRLVGMCD